ncbi:MAG TPA: glycosyltransferase [Parvularculaceae bacterium]|nr:glycosyltransferase [Parvularculaceae bacterium]
MRTLLLLHVFPSFARGGQQMRLAAISAKGGERFRHRVVSLDGDLSARSAFAPDAATFEAFAVRKSKWLSIANLAAFRRLIRESKADILCTYNFGAIEAAIANRFGSEIAHIHYEDGFGPDETIERQKRRRILARRFALQKSFVVAPSRGLERAAREVWRLNPDRVRYIPNGVDFRRFGALRRDRAEGAPIVVGAVGALRPEKNFERLVSAFSAAGAADARLTIYGDGPERSALAALAAATSDRVLLPGATAAPARAYADFDIFALSSDTEQAPLTVLEAMASGLPVVAPNIGDIAGMVSEENRAFLTPPGDEAALAAAIKRLVSDPALRRRLGEANATRAREAFALEPAIAAHEALFLEAARERA